MTGNGQSGKAMTDHSHHNNMQDFVYLALACSLHFTSNGLNSFPANNKYLTILVKGCPIFYSACASVSIIHQES